LVWVGFFRKEKEPPNHEISNFLGHKDLKEQRRLGPSKVPFRDIMLKSIIEYNSR
jgi:hypothetical protein